METNDPELKQGKSTGNRFVRHPVATITILWAITLLIFMLALELFLKNFSGLGNPLLYELSPLYGYRLKANQIIEPTGGMGLLYAARVTTNNLGLRAAGEWDSNPVGKILFLGDSVTYGGQYVADAQLFSSVAGSRLQGWQIGNGGVNAWGVENIVGLVKDYRFTPAEVVVTTIIEWDFYRGLTRAPSMPLWTERPAYALQHLLMHAIWRVNKLRYDMSDAGAQNEAHCDMVVDRAVRGLKALDDYLNQKQVRHFIFILPTKSQLVDGEPADRRVSQALGRYGIDAEYLLPKLLGQEPNSEIRSRWFHDEAHLEVSGHRMYGMMIGNALAKVLPGR